jgi:Rps23 Pro-64 3,4-dihydroxylase Tpa1-like proline 4-hydroxylase
MAGFDAPFAHVAIPDAFGPALSEALLDHALAHQAQFRRARIDVRDRAGQHDDTVRVSAVLADLGALGPALEAQLRALVPRLVATLRAQPFELARVEMELAAHGDGAFFTRHVDNDRFSNQRMLSVLYYVNRRPKRFSGGALRLHALAGGRFVDVEPQHDLLVAFPAWAPHEVLPVACPSGDFADQRFALNVWLHRPSPDAPRGAAR